MDFLVHQNDSGKANWINVVTNMTNEKDMGKQRDVYIPRILCRSGTRYGPIWTCSLPFWQLNHANSAYFGAISANFPEIRHSAPSFCKSWIQPCCSPLFVFRKKNEKRLFLAGVINQNFSAIWRLRCAVLIKGVLHPRPVFGLFLHFSQKLQHIGSK